MSGGSFNYDCFRIRDFAEELRHKLDINDSEERDGFGDYKGRHFNSEVVNVLEESYSIIEKAGRLAREIEWLYSGDHSEESFLRLTGDILSKSKHGMTGSVMSIGRPCHFRPTNENRSACGIECPEYASYDARDVDCIRCRETKVWKEYMQHMLV